LSAAFLICINWGRRICDYDHLSHDELSQKEAL
jgi:hypothetical protein